MKKLILFSLLTLFQYGLAENGVVLFLKVDGSINPASSDYLHEGIKRAEERNAMCVVVELNTPGGLLQSTRMIVTDFLTSTVPVVVYVSPAGSQSASAGVFVTLGRQHRCHGSRNEYRSSAPCELARRHGLNDVGEGHKRCRGVYQNDFGKKAPEHALG